MTIKRAAILTTVLAVLLGLGTITCGLLGIWTGDGRWGATAFVSGTTMIVVGAVSGFMWSEVPP